MQTPSAKQIISLFLLHAACEQFLLKSSPVLHPTLFISSLEHCPLPNQEGLFCLLHEVVDGVPQEEAAEAADLSLELGEAVRLGLAEDPKNGGIKMQFFCNLWLLCLLGSRVHQVEPHLSSGSLKHFVCKNL